MTQVRAVLFDLDGTLTDTVRLIAQHIARVLSTEELVVPASEVYPFIGQPLAVAFSALAGVSEQSPRYAQLAQTYRAGARAAVEEAGENLVLPGVRQTLLYLRESRIPVAVVTAKDRGQAQHLLRNARLMEFIDEIVGTDDVARGKPNPDPALLGAQHLGASPGDCVYVGDAVTDVQMAVAAGMPCYAVTTGASSAQELRAAGAIEVADRVDELVKYWQLVG